jgi:ADP-ribose pyrophosphatase YjhB (NUDIX family)
MTQDSETPPVRLIGRRAVAANSKWTVYFDHIRALNGTEVENYLSLLPIDSRPDRITGVGVLPLIGDDVVLMRAYRHPIESFTWELPRGFIDKGEEPGEAALRELEEESGLICTLERLEFLGLGTPEASTIIGRAALFAAHDCQPGGRVLDDEPGLGIAHRFSRAEAGAMLNRNEIEDMGTQIALYRVLARPKRNLSLPAESPI